LSLQPLLPAGCREALAVVDRYYRSAGSTELSQQAAATQAYQGMMRASSTAQGAVYSVTVALSQDFSNMRFILAGTVSGDYAAAQARTDGDARALRDVCGSDDN
jgi:phage portal protein BeeE